MNTFSRLALVALCGLAPASAQDFFPELFNPLVPFPPAAPVQQNVRPENGPWNNDVIVYRVRSEGGFEKLSSFERAGVPTLARMADGRLIAAHQHFPENDPASFDKVAIHFSSDEGKTWTPAVVMKLNGLPTGMRFPFDPTLVPLPDGRVRMYFTSLQGRRFDEDLPRIHSAISKDGIEYEFEPGVRFSIEGRSVIDCAVALHQGVFHLFSPDNGEQPKSRGRPSQGPEMRPTDGVGYHATSTDGLNFTRAEDVKVEGRRRWLGNAQSDGKVITFFGSGEGVFTAKSADGRDWQVSTRFPVMGADPGAVAAKDDGWILAVTGPPRNQPQPSLAMDARWLGEWDGELVFFDRLRNFDK
ncbi:exo-alpha-sialidase [Prosthecobacter sp.]|uniref:exo-alpha-sialidase n=1 Tax=Prosthecobacter sp. TaxID=1965333 RepID=UPI003784050E